MGWPQAECNVPRAAGHGDCRGHLPHCAQPPPGGGTIIIISILKISELKLRKLRNSGLWASGPAAGFVNKILLVEPLPFVYTLSVVVFVL